MANPIVVITEVGDLDKLFARLAVAIDSTAVLDDAGAILLRRIRLRFRSEQDPDGVTWPESKAAARRKAGKYTYRRGRKWTGTGTLFETGDLFHSIQLAGTGPNQRTIASATPYGHYHQEGKGQVRRAFMGFNNADVIAVEKMVLDRIARELGQ
jgi:phage gpG-like protein